MQEILISFPICRSIQSKYITAAVWTMEADTFSEVFACLFHEGLTQLFTTFSSSARRWRSQAEVMYWTNVRKFKREPWLWCCESCECERQSLRNIRFIKTRATLVRAAFARVGCCCWCCCCRGLRGLECRNAMKTMHVVARLLRGCCVLLEPVASYNDASLISRACLIWRRLE